MLGVADCVADGVWFTVPQPTKWQRIRNQINTAMILAWSDFVKVHGNAQRLAGIWLGGALMRKPTTSLQKMV